jgi:hypothetical protein
VFAFTSGDQESDYTPPGGQSFNTHTDYDLDRQVSNVSRPDGDFITPSYDPVKGRLTALTTSRGTNTYGYSSSTGQLTSINTFDGVGLTYGYDGALLKDITWSGPVSGNVHKTYDSSFRLASESVPGQGRGDDRHPATRRRVCSRHGPRRNPRGRAPATRTARSNRYGDRHSGENEDGQD